MAILFDRDKTLFYSITIKPHSILIILLYSDKTLIQQNTLRFYSHETVLFYYDSSVSVCYNKPPFYSILFVLLKLHSMMSKRILVSSISIRVCSLVTTLFYLNKSCVLFCSIPSWPWINLVLYYGINRFYSILVLFMVKFRSIRFYSEKTLLYSVVRCFLGRSCRFARQIHRTERRRFWWQGERSRLAGAGYCCVVAEPWRLYFLLPFQVFRRNTMEKGFLVVPTIPATIYDTPARTTTNKTSS